MNKLNTSLAAVMLVSAAFAGNVSAIYLNDDAGVTVSLGPTMVAEPFENQTTAISLANAIDADSPATIETHVSPTTHVWYDMNDVRNGGLPLELIFNLGAEYDLTELHFWNYHTEAFDVDEINFSFFTAAMGLVGTLDFFPTIGVGVNQEAQDYLLSFPARVQFVNAKFSGTNGQVDFNNVGFTGELNECEINPSLPQCQTGGGGVPVPGTVLLIGLGIAGIRYQRRARA